MSRVPVPPHIDTKHCPRDDGGHLRLVFDDPEEGKRWECSTCSRWWSVIELKRDPETKVVDLMAALEASVAAAKEARRRHPTPTAEGSDATGEPT